MDYELYDIEFYIIYDVFIRLSFWRHPFTDAVTHFYKSVKIQQMFIFE